MYRRRVALEWRTAVAVVLAAVVALVLARLSVQDMWWLSILGAIFLVGVLAVAAAFRYPLDPPPAFPKRYSYNDNTLADEAVRRGQPVDPPELQAAAIGHARRGLRMGHLHFGWFPVMGATWAVRIGGPGFFGGFGYFGLGLMLFGTSGLVWSGVTQHRLDRLDRLEDASAGDAPAAATT